MDDHNYLLLHAHNLSILADIIAQCYTLKQSTIRLTTVHILQWFRAPLIACAPAHASIPNGPNGPIVRHGPCQARLLLDSLTAAILRTL